jgi:hypothetical protein
MAPRSGWAVDAIGLLCAAKMTAHSRRDRGRCVTAVGERSIAVQLVDSHLAPPSLDDRGDRR